MNKWMNEEAARCGIDTRPWGTAQKRLLGGVSECEAVLYYAWTWEVLTLNKVQTLPTCFFTQGQTTFLCTLKDFHSLNYRERGGKMGGGGSDQQELGSRELCPTFWVRRDHRPERDPLRPAGSCWRRIQSFSVHRAATYCITSLLPVRTESSDYVLCYL